MSPTKNAPILFSTLTLPVCIQYNIHLLTQTSFYFLPVTVLQKQKALRKGFLLFFLMHQSTALNPCGRFTLQPECTNYAPGYLYLCSPIEGIDLH